MEPLEPAAMGVVVGDPADRGTEMGPLVSRRHFESVAAYVPDDAPVAFRGSAPTAPILVPANEPPRGTDRTVTEEIRPGGGGAAARRRGRRHRTGQ